MIVLVAQVTEVRCTNCGADSWTKVAAIATIVGLAIAVAAFVISRKAAKSAEASLTLTRDQFEIAKAEHVEFLRELRAHPDLHVEFDPGASPDSAGYIRYSGSSANLQAKITIRNEGDRSSGRTLVEFFVPEYINDMLFGWQDAGGQPLDGRPWSMQSRVLSDVTLDDGEGHTFRARRLPLDLDDVAPALPAELPLSLPVGIPDRGGVVPYRIRVTAERISEPVLVEGEFRVAPPDTSGGVVRH